MDSNSATLSAASRKGEPLDGECGAEDWPKEYHTTSSPPDAAHSRLLTNNMGRHACTNDDVEETKGNMMFGVEERPPIHIALLYSMQQILGTIGGPVAVIYIIHASICASGNDLLLAELLSTCVFMVGVCTLMQVTVGIRLPILQGSNMVFPAVVAALMNLDNWRCTAGSGAGILSESNNTNWTNTSVAQEEWRPRLLEISGSLAVASVTQVVIGCTGVMGYLMDYIGPLTIVPTVGLIPLSLFPVASKLCEDQWGIALGTIVLMIIFVVVLEKVKMPLPKWSRAEGCGLAWYRVFKLFPHALAIVLMWLLCYVLTVTEVFPDDPKTAGYKARTDAKLDALYDSKWFFFPYPGQWGTPTFGTGAYLAMLGATIASIVESVGDYYATARVLGVPPPPKHAVNRGIAVEGLGSVLSGLVGAAHATTSYSQVIGFISTTGMGSRFVWMVTSIILIFCGVFGKFGGMLSCVPDPIVGGVTALCLGVILPIAMENLKHVNLRSVRNQIVIGTSFMVGMMIPFWINANVHAIDTGFKQLDQTIVALLGTAMLVGGTLGFVLDNALPGSAKDRGLLLHSSMDDVQTGESLSIYDIPAVSRWLQRWRCVSFCPISPTYIDRSCCRCCTCRRTAVQQRSENTAL